MLETGAAFALPILTVLLPILGVGPPVVRGSSAVNTLYNVQMWVGEFNSAGNYGPGVLAQEVCEWWLRWAIGIAISTPFVVAGIYYGISPYYAPFAQLFGCFWTIPFARWFDSIGHNIEIVVAERNGLDGYRGPEVTRMVRGKEWRGFTPEQGDEYLRGTEGFAKAVLRVMDREWKN